MAMELDYDRSLHEEFQAGPFFVTEETVRAFRQSIGETEPIFNDGAAGYRGIGIMAPPTFCTLFVRHVELPSINLKFGRTRFHAGQRIQTRRAIVVGDSLTASSHLKEVYPKTGRSGTMVFIVWETTFRNQRGEIVAEVQESFAARE